MSIPAMNDAAAGTILVIVDPTARHHAGVAKGALLAQRSGARMELFSRDGQLSKACSSEAVSLVSQATAILEALARPLRAYGLNVTTQGACAGPMHRVLADRVEHSCAKLVIKDVHQQSTSQRALLSDADWELIRDCPVSLLLSKPRLWSEAPRICAAVDPGHQRFAPVEHAVLEQGAALARRLDGGLHVIHAYIPPALVIPARQGDESTVLQSTRAVSDQWNARLMSLKVLTSGYGVPESHAHLAMGCVCDVLSSFVSQLAASVVVLGALSRGILRRGVVGSTAEAILGQVPCDALVVKAPESAGWSVLS